MSEATTQRLKVSREGMILIKSFEGFRSRAVRDEDGGWVIGYGHTLSAREGLMVGEADAELLLQYDLLPVVKMLNDQAGGLNQHQFDALASFAFSIGIDRFTSSDVARRVSSGALGEAADALIGWPEPTPPEASLRRRAAERALFVADPANPVTLADLLAAPLPPPQIVAPEPPAADARAAAVATLLGEETVTATTEPAPEVVAADKAPAGAEPAPEQLPESVLEPETEPQAFHTPPTAPVNVAASFNFQRFSPYSASIVGPLPGLGNAGADAPNVSLEIATPVTPAVEPSAVENEVSEIAPGIAPEPTPDPAPVADGFPPLAEPASFPLPAPSIESQPPALILTPLGDGDVLSIERPVWGEQQRVTPAADQDALFEDEPIELSVLRHEEIVEPRRFDSAQAAFMIMGGVGLASCAASAAAFRQAIEDTSGLNDYTLLGWTLAIIGGVCVVASALNLYPRLFPPKGQ